MLLAVRNVGKKKKTNIKRNSENKQFFSPEQQHGSEIPPTPHTYKNKNNSWTKTTAALRKSLRDKKKKKKIVSCQAGALERKSFLELK